ncbi:hypothetical protein ASG87_13465 [Frateuria sp. Soil773]|uniref:YybH family protein n=1 Tax=Frateuria sp. Soil773 TaxID=1736407 RepID=UPI0006FAD455|nr:nuclear transport factor 2 family protein [Frateuria sp. Soil773]KRE99990.1 hypothetical protein ASG87_13465 [Frateuria sp. Soil773]
MHASTIAAWNAPGAHGRHSCRAGAIGGHAPSPADAGVVHAIRRVIHAQSEAIRRKDADAVMACNAPHMRTFGIVAPLPRCDPATVRERLEHWFAAFSGPLGCEAGEPDISAAGDTACARFLQRFSGTNASGMPVDLRVRVTMGLQRIGDRWLVAHEHLSDPLDPPPAPACRPA